MKNVVARSTLTRYMAFTEKDAKPDREKGRRDGKNAFPRQEALEPSPHELERVGQAKAAITAYDRHLHDVREQLELDIASREQELNEGYLGQKESVIHAKEAALETIRQESGANSEGFRQLYNIQEEKKENYRRVELRLNRPLQVHFVRVYMVMLVVLAILEAPINKLAVEFFFQESQLLALVLALTIGVVLVSLAHFLGVLLRQGGHYREKLGLKYYLGGLFVILAVAGSMIYLISSLRQQYVNFLSQEQQTDLAALLLSDGVGGLFERSIQTELGIAGLTLLVLNASIFLLGVLFSFLRHDSDPDYERVTLERDKAVNNLVAYRNRFEQRATELQREFDEKITYLEKKSLDLEAEIRELQSQRESLEIQREHDLNIVIDVLRQQILAYQSGNVEARNGNGVPDYFGEPPLTELQNRVAA